MSYLVKKQQIARLEAALGRRITKKFLVDLLADDRVRKYPTLYAGHREDAEYFWAHQSPTLSDLILAAQAHKLIPSDWELPPAPLKHPSRRSR